MFILKRAKCFFKKIGHQRQREDMRNQPFIHLNSATIKIISGCFKTNKKPTTTNKNSLIQSKRIWRLLRLLTVPVQLRPSPVYPGLHVQTCDPCLLLQVAFTWHLQLSGYVLHSSISVKKRKKRENNENGIWFSFKSHTCTCIWKKWNTRLQFLGFMRFSGWTCESNRYCSNFFTLVQQRLSKAYAINCSCFATGAQNTLHKQQKKERIKVNHLWPHFLVIPNSPVQFVHFLLERRRTFEVNKKIKQIKQKQT